MPEEPTDPCPPDAENNTPDAPPARSGPLQRSEKSDAGCLILLGAAFIGVFLFPAALLLGGAPLIVPLITVLLLVILTPFVNPLEGRSVRAKWWGRVVTFLFLAGLFVAFWFWVSRGGEMMKEEY